MPTTPPEPWLRGTLSNVDPIRRQILHALELTAEDFARWTPTLTPADWHAQPFALPSVAFHLRHIARSLDRLLTYAEARTLSPSQHVQLASEHTPGPTPEELRAELQTALATARTRILALDPSTIAEPRTVGRRHLPTTVVGLLIHCAEHTQRHAGQAITTAKLLLALRQL